MKTWSVILLSIILSSCSSIQEDTSKKKANILYQYGSQKLAEGMYTIALENLINANEADPNNPDIINNLALAYYYKKRPTIAKKLLKDVIKINPNHSDALNNLGTLNMSTGDLGEAEKYFQKVSKHLLFKKQFVTYHNLSKIADQKGKIKLSRHYNKKSLEEFDNYCPALFHRGLLFYKEKKWEKANNAFKKASRGVCYNYAETHFYRALSLKQLNQLEQAQKILEKLNTDFPKNNYITQAQLELEEIKRLKNSSNYLQRKRSIRTPQF